MIKQEPSVLPLKQAQHAVAKNVGSYKNPILYTGGIFVALIATAVVVVNFAMALPLRERVLLFDEGGIVESASVWIYLLVVAALIFAAGLQLKKKNNSVGARAKRSLGPLHPWMLAGLVGCFAARELDCHTRFTSMSVMKTRFFVSGEVHTSEKLVALLILSTIGYLVIRLFTIYGHQVFKRFKNCHLQGILPVLACLLVVFAKGLDAGMGTLFRIGMLDQMPWQKSIQATEEVSELLIPIVFLMMVGSTLIPIFQRFAAKPEHETDDHADLHENKQAA